MTSAPSFDLLPFRSWLLNRHYSDSTVRNYIVDVNRYLSSLVSVRAGQYPAPSEIFSSDNLSSHLASLRSDPNRGRYFSSLNLFCQFALDQQLITQNPIKNIQKNLEKSPLFTPSDLVNRFQKHLEKKNTPSATIRNYINDLHQYISWLETNHTQNPPPFGSPSLDREAKKPSLIAPLSRGGGQRPEGF